MLSPYKSPHRDNGRTAVPLRGLFVDGIWRCNCPLRPPAAKFQTRNRGVNHGRWFYTCQQPKEMQCDFFLWASDAEARAKLVILASSHSEKDVQTKTPLKSYRYKNGLPTPATDRRTSEAAAKSSDAQTPSKSAKAIMMEEDSPGMESFGWDDDLNDEIGSLFEPLRQPVFGRDMPRRASEIPAQTSPGKRKRSNFDGNSDLTELDSSVRTPQRRLSQPQPQPWPATALSAEVSTTPTPSRYTDVLLTDFLEDTSEFTNQILKLLDGYNVVLPRRAQNELVSLLNMQDLKAKGIARGRDISRIALKKRDEQIAELKEKIESLESQVEPNRMIANGRKDSTLLENNP